MKEQSLLTPIKAITKEYSKLDSRIFWTDLIVCALVGWATFVGYFFTENVYLKVLLMTTATILLYRGTCFIHEISHFDKKIPSLKYFYNIFFGFPNRYPFYIYEPHFFHHGLKTFGTEEDPEYKYMGADSKWRILDPFWNATILPIFQFIRFGIIPFVSIFHKDFSEAIFKKFSTLVMNMGYTRSLSKNWRKKALLNDISCAIYIWIPVILASKKLIPLEVLLWHNFIIIVASFFNMYRAKFNHVYLNKSERMNKSDHLTDSVTIEGGILAEIWAPLGLRYHTLHHVASEIPYYSLKKAHHKLMDHLPEDHPYRTTVVRGLAQACSFHLKKVLA